MTDLKSPRRKEIGGAKLLFVSDGQMKGRMRTNLATQKPPCLEHHKRNRFRRMSGGEGQEGSTITNGKCVGVSVPIQDVEALREVTKRREAQWGHHQHLGNVTVKARCESRRSSPRQSSWTLRYEVESEVKMTFSFNRS